MKNSKKEDIQLKIENDILKGWLEELLKNLDYPDFVNRIRTNFYKKYPDKD